MVDLEAVGEAGRTPHHSFEGSGSDNPAAEKDAEDLNGVSDQARVSDPLVQFVDQEGEQDEPEPERVAVPSEAQAIEGRGASSPVQRPEAPPAGRSRGLEATEFQIATSMLELLNVRGCQKPKPLPLFWDY